MLILTDQISLPYLFPLLLELLGDMCIVIIC